MYGRLDVSTSQEAQRITCVDRQTAIERLSPLPTTGLVVADLKSRHGLAEEQGDGAQVGVATRPKAISELLDLLLVEFGILHVSQVRLVVRLPLVHLSEEVRRQLES